MAYNMNEIIDGIWEVKKKVKIKALFFLLELQLQTIQVEMPERERVKYIR